MAHARISVCVFHKAAFIVHWRNNWGIMKHCGSVYNTNIERNTTALLRLVYFSTHNGRSESRKQPPFGRCNTITYECIRWPNGTGHCSDLLRTVWTKYGPFSHVCHYVQSRQRLETIAAFCVIFHKLAEHCYIPQRKLTCTC